MTWAVLPGDKGRRARRWWAVAATLLVIAVVLIAAGLYGHRDALSAPVASPVQAPSVDSGAAAPDSTVVADPGMARSTPVELRIPSIDVAVSLSGLGLNSDGTVEVPSNFAEPGWFALGPSPGQVGSAVILGHVDSYRGPAVFFQLRSLQAGDPVEVGLADGAVAHFVVTSVATYLKDEFPARQVYASHGFSALQLVTCGGAFDSHSRSYLSNVVVYTSLVTTNGSKDQPLRAA